MAELNFYVSDRLVIDGNDIAIDYSVDWNSIGLTTAIGMKKADKKAHPYQTGDDTFLGILASKNIKSDIEVAGVNSIEVASLVSGYYYNVINGGTDAVAIGDTVKVSEKGFEKDTTGNDAVAVVVSGGAAGEAIKIRGGK